MDFGQNQARMSGRDYPIRARPDPVHDQIYSQL
ncbi:hypothetical protein COLO4_09213 [Corchorus olitorius]|uniref:Uncharacterized protein n=1 Tax=Corchorus olitorius TaxID=93759 RepID=A0A1R3KCT1_9ROSI|nr:hypothetical protein COLO4_09213 [Corchorus olitorius]